MKRILKHTLILLCVCALFSTMLVYTSAKEEKVRTHVVCGFYAYDGSTETKPSGYLYQYMETLASYIGWDIEYVMINSASEAMTKLLLGEVDMVPGLTKTSERSQIVYFTDEPMEKVATGVYTSGANNHFYTDIHELDGKTIAVPLGENTDLLDAWMRENGIQLQYRYCDAKENRFELVLRGELEFAYGTGNSLPPGLALVSKIKEEECYLCINMNRKDLLNQANEARSIVDSIDPSLISSLQNKYNYQGVAETSLTQAEDLWLSNHDCLRIGVYANNKPNAYVDEEGNINGFAKMLIDKMVGYLEVNLKCEYKSFNTLEEMIKALKNNQIDCMFPFYCDIDSAKEHGLTISKKVHTESLSLIYQKGMTQEEGMRKVVIDGSQILSEFMEKEYPNMITIVVPNVETSMQHVRDGMAFGCICNSSNTGDILNKYKGLESVVLEKGCDVCFASTPENYGLIVLLNRGLQYFSQEDIASLVTESTPATVVSIKDFLKTHKGIFWSLIFACILVLALIILLIVVHRWQVTAKKQAIEADYANTEKTRFLYELSHDIRTPMNAIIGYTNMAASSVKDPEQTQKYLQKISQSNVNLMKVIENILNVSKMDNEEEIVEEVKVNIEEFCNDIAIDAQKGANEKRIHFNTYYEGIDGLTVYADPKRMKKILMNILTNSFQYMATEGSVFLNVKQVPANKKDHIGIEYSIEDTGIGMEKEDLEHIFDVTQISRKGIRSTLKKRESGLPIVKKLLDQMDGSIDIHSEFGNGTTVIIHMDYLPYDENAVVASTPKLNREVHTILLVDDNDLNREMTAELLEDYGFVVTMAQNGEIAIQTIQKNGISTYDIILMDIEMPIMNGYDATKAIRQMDDGKDIPIMALSANAREEDIQQAKKVGMNDYIVKPIDIQALVKKIKQ